MNWTVLIPIILQYGVPFAEKIWTLFSSGKAPSQADWDELKKLAAQTATTQMTDALVRAGIDLNSDTAKALLALVA